MGINHQQMELFLAVFVMHGGEQHAAGFYAHHGTGRQVRDGDQRLAHQLLRLVIGVDSAQNDPVRAGAVVQNELQELLGLLHGFAFLDLHGAESGLGEGVKIHLILEQRLDLNIGKINRLVLNLDLDRARCTADDGDFLGLFLRLGSVQRLHGGDKIPHME